MNTLLSLENISPITRSTAGRNKTLIRQEIVSKDRSVVNDVVNPYRDRTKPNPAGCRLGSTTLGGINGTTFRTWKGHAGSKTVPRPSSEASVREQHNVRNTHDAGQRAARTESRQGGVSFGVAVSHRDEGNSLGLVKDRNHHPFSSTVHGGTINLSTFWDYRKKESEKGPKAPSYDKTCRQYDLATNSHKAKTAAKRVRHWSMTQAQESGGTAAEELNGPAEAFSAPVYGTQEWHRRIAKGSMRKATRVPVPTHGKANARSLYAPYAVGEKAMDSSFLNGENWVEVHRNEGRFVSEQCNQSPYPLMRGVPRSHLGAWGDDQPKPKRATNPELFPATLNPLRMDSTLVIECPRGPVDERPFPANARDYAPKTRQDRVRRTMPDFQPQCGRQWDSHNLRKWNVGYNDLHTRHELDRGSRAGMPIAQTEAQMQKHLAILHKYAPSAKDSSCHVEIVSQNTSHLDSRLLHKHNAAR